MSVQILKKYQTPQFLAYMARQMASHARENIQVSRNLDGSPMTTQKRRGKPLVSTGHMLASIQAIDNKCIVDVPYAAEVQKRTGNQFIGQPRPEVWQKWLQDYQNANQ